MKIQASYTTQLKRREQKRGAVGGCAGILKVLLIIDSFVIAYFFLFPSSSLLSFQSVILRGKILQDSSTATTPRDEAVGAQDPWVALLLAVTVHCDTELVAMTLASNYLSLRNCARYCFTDNGRVNVMRGLSCSRNNCLVRAEIQLGSDLATHPVLC